MNWSELMTIEGTADDDRVWDNNERRLRFFLSVWIYWRKKNPLDVAQASLAHVDMFLMLFIEASCGDP